MNARIRNQSRPQCLTALSYLAVGLSLALASPKTSWAEFRTIAPEITVEPIPPQTAEAIRENTPNDQEAPSESSAIQGSEQEVEVGSSRLAYCRELKAEIRLANGQLSELSTLSKDILEVSLEYAVLLRRYTINQNDWTQPSAVNPEAVLQKQTQLLMLLERFAELNQETGGVLALQEEISLKTQIFNFQQCGRIVGEP